MESCDVLVVGLGPAGGAAAMAAAEAGLKVIAVERRRQIGQPVQCAECVPAAMGRLVRRTGCEVQRVDAMRTILPSGSLVDSVFRGIMIDRAKLDGGLAHLAEKAGATLYVGWRLDQLDAAQGKALCYSQGKRVEILYRCLIAADGPYSPVAEALGLAPHPLALARQITVPLLKPLAETEVYLSPSFPGGYGWLFPKGERANLGVGVTREAGSILRARVLELHGRLVKEGHVGSEILARTGGAIPLGGLRRNLVVKNAVFVGDAGGFSHPVTGAGIHPAVTSGEAAGMAAARWLGGDKAALEAYQGDMEELFGPSLSWALQRRSQMNDGEENDQAFRRGWVAFPEYYGQDGAMA